MAILLIGATGFIGPHVVRALVRAEHDVIAFHRGETEADLPDVVQFIHGNRDALPDYRDAFEAANPDVVIDLVPYTETQAQQAIDVFTGLADRLVAVSSSDVYRNYDGWRGVSTHDPDPVPLGETAPLRENFYPYRGYEELDFAYAENYDKIRVERVVMSASELIGTVLRLPAVYGSGDSQHRFAPHLRRMEDERPAILLNEEQARWRWTHGYVENVAAAIARAATDARAAGRTYNVGEVQTPPVAERVRRLREIVGWTGDVVPLSAEELPDSLQTPFDWRYELATDTRRIRDELDFQAPVGREEALRRTIAWQRAHLDDANVVPDYEAEDAVLEQ